MLKLLKNDQELPLLMSYDDATRMNHQTKLDSEEEQPKSQPKATTSFWGSTEAKPAIAQPASKEPSPFVL